MSISSSKKIPVINRITHQELQLIYGITKKGAEKKLSAIRASLDKKKNQTLTVVAFCRVEGITLDEFDLLFHRAMGGTKPPTSPHIPR